MVFLAHKLYFFSLYSLAICLNSSAYLFNLQETYTQYIKQHHIKTLFVDASNADFIGNEAHLNCIIDALDKDYEDGQHFITLP